MLRDAYGAHPAQFVRLSLPAVPPLATIILVHGGYWKNKYTVDNAAMSTLPAALNAAGFAAVEVEYRRRDDEGGGWPGTCDDMVAALAHVRHLCLSGAPGWSKLDGADFVLLGHSAGGHGALVMAHSSAVRLTVAVAPVADLVAGYERRLSDEGDAVLRFIGREYEQDPQLYRDASPAHTMLPLRTPTLIVTGDQDVDVPVDLTRAFAAKAADAAANDPSSPNPTYLEIPDADHYTLLDAASPHWAILLDGIRAALASS